MTALNKVFLNGRPYHVFTAKPVQALEEAVKQAGYWSWHDYIQVFGLKSRAEFLVADGKHYSFGELMEEMANHVASRQQLSG